jgi:photosystem II stability/assembly factor-like uncharacterized protein
VLRRDEREDACGLFELAAHGCLRNERLWTERVRPSTQGSALRQSGSDPWVIDRRARRPNNWHVRSSLVATGLSCLSIAALGACGGGSPSTDSATGTSDGGGVATTSTSKNANTARWLHVAKANAGYPNSIAFWNPTDGLIATGYEWHHECAGTIALTDDGGSTFHTVLRRRGVFEGAITAGGRDAWVRIRACAQGRQNPARLLHSGDGGRSWHTVASVKAWNPSFGTREVGLSFAGHEGVAGIANTPNMLATSDGGRTWHPIKGPCSRDSDGGAVSLADRSHAWAVCTYTVGAGGQNKTIYASADSGHTWQEVAHAHPERSSVEPSAGGYVGGISFLSNGVGFLVTDTWLYRSEDGGMTWQIVPWSSLPSLRSRRGKQLDAEGVQALMVSPSDAIALTYYLGGAKQLAHSEDGGQTWAVVHEWPGPPGK